MNSIDFSIIIPTYLRQDVVTKTLKYLELQSYKNFEIIIVDQANTIYALKSRLSCLKKQ